MCAGIKMADMPAPAPLEIPAPLTKYTRLLASGSCVRTSILLLVMITALSACDRSPFDRTEQNMDQAEQKQAARDYRGAINAYEHALDGSAKTADAHFRMGIIYAEKLDDPVSAVHHFRRYIELTPNGSHVGEAKANLARLELTLATKLAGGTLISHTEALRLRAENGDLRKQLAARGNPANGAGSPPIPVAQNSQGKPVVGRTYQVQPGDTLASIARKFYKTKARAKDIQDANLNSVPDATKLKTGQILIIP